MAINGPTLVNGTWFDTANAAIFNTDVGTNPYTVQLVAGRRYYMVICNYGGTNPQYPATVRHDPAGTPLSFTLVTAGGIDAKVQAWGSAVSPARDHFSVWEVNVTSTTGTAKIEIDYVSGNNQSAVGAGLFYIDGEDDVGTTVQVVTANGQSTDPAVTMAAFGATDNLLLLCVARDDPAASFTVTESRTELYENLETERNSSTTHYQNPHGGDTSVGCTITSDHWAAIGIEIKAAGAATSAKQEGSKIIRLW